jgi:hypothetical protein
VVKATRLRPENEEEVEHAEAAEAAAADAAAANATPAGGSEEGHARTRRFVPAWMLRRRKATLKTPWREWNFMGFDAGQQMSRIIARSKHLRSRIVIRPGTGHIDFCVLRMLCVLAWALGASHLAQFTVFKSLAGVVPGRVATVVTRR